MSPLTTTLSAAAVAPAAEALAIDGGPRAVPRNEPDLFHWPIVTAEDEAAVLAVLRAGNMSDWGITQQFEREWARYNGSRFALAHCNGTTALLAAMFACGIGRGDEMICPSVTYWASALGVMSLGATPVFCDIDPVTLCIDPTDIEHRITPRTKAIMVVHYCGHPCDMDRVMAIANRHGVKVIEDVSHAHGAMYKGKMVGSIGHVSGMSMMARKSFAIGEAGMLCTDDRAIYERAIAFAHYERAQTDITDPQLRALVGPPGFATGLPLGGVKGRMNQTCSAMGLVQLKHYPRRMKDIQDAMNRFWDYLEGTPGLRAHRPTSSDVTMGGWYNPVGHYVPEELGDLPVERFVDAVNAEGGASGRGVNFPLHLHPVLHKADVYHDGKPTTVAFSQRDVRQGPGSLPVCERIAQRSFAIPWFKHDRPDAIRRYANAYKKVALNADKLLKRG
jgi:dTDP-4-amino-4,6-dideoxygalactose transaminase